MADDETVKCPVEIICLSLGSRIFVTVGIEASSGLLSSASIACSIFRKRPTISDGGGSRSGGKSKSSSVVSERLVAAIMAAYEKGEEV